MTKTTTATSMLRCFDLKWVPVFVAILSVLLVNNSVAPALNTPTKTNSEAASAGDSSSSNSNNDNDNNDNGRLFSPEEHLKFSRDGYLVIPADRFLLLNSQQIDNLVRAGESKIATHQGFPFYFTVSAMGAMFEQDGAQEETSSSSSSSFNNDCSSPSPCAMKEEKEGAESSFTTDAFREAALFSNLPRAAAELMQLDPRTQTLRVLRDIFFAKSITDNGEGDSCDWHVDDIGFWPQSFLSDSTEGGDHGDDDKDQNGINVWIALDDMPAQYQGSMALAPGSHKAPWRHEAYLALGQNRSEDGGRTKEQVIEKRKKDQEEKAKAAEEGDDSKKIKYQTCDLGIVNPQLQETIEKSAHVLDIKRGDVILATRNLFHKTIPVTTPEGVEYYQSMGQEYLKRYSIRYVPGSARLPNGWSVEWSVVQDATNSGRRLDDVRDSDGSNMMFYPRVWPQPEDDIKTGLDKMAAAVEDLKQRANAEFMATIFANSQ